MIKTNDLALNADEYMRKMSEAKEKILAKMKDQEKEIRILSTIHDTRKALPHPGASMDEAACLFCTDHSSSHGQRSSLGDSQRQHYHGIVEPCGILKTKKPSTESEQQHSYTRTSRSRGDTVSSLCVIPTCQEDGNVRSRSTSLSWSISSIWNRTTRQGKMEKSRPILRRVRTFTDGSITSTTSSTTSNSSVIIPVAPHTSCTECQVSQGWMSHPFRPGRLSAVPAQEAAPRKMSCT